MDELILTFLNRNFQVDYDTNNIRLCFNSDWQGRHSLFEVEKTIVLIFDVHHNICHNWLLEKFEKLRGEINTYLGNHKLTLSLFEWLVVDENNRQFSYDEQMELLREKFNYTSSILKYLFDNWFDDKMYAESERLMNEY